MPTGVELPPDARTDWFCERDKALKDAVALAAAFACFSSAAAARSEASAPSSKALTKAPCPLTVKSMSIPSGMMIPLLLLCLYYS